MLMNVSCFTMVRQRSCVYMPALTQREATAAPALLDITRPAMDAAAKVDSHFFPHARKFFFPRECHILEKVTSEKSHYYNNYCYFYFYFNPLFLFQSLCHVLVAWCYLFPDIDECAARQNNCTKDQMCINTYGSFQCVSVTCPKIPNAAYVKTSPMWELMHYICQDVQFQTLLTFFKMLNILDRAKARNLKKTSL